MILGSTTTPPPKKLTANSRCSSIKGFGELALLSLATIFIVEIRLGAGPEAEKRSFAPFERMG